MKPILRANQFYDLKMAVDTAVNDFVKHPAAYPFQNCLNCMEWDYTEDICGKHKAKPPTHILIYSCPDYKDDGEIPY